MNIQDTLNHLRRKLDKYRKQDINHARIKLFDKISKSNTSRCWRKLNEIDKKFKICKNINTFLDLCGGPGEFTKYILYTNPFCTGFGISLINNAACKYQPALCNRQNFTQIIGPNMTGNIMDKDIIFEMSLKCGNMCDLVLADGAVDVSGHENEQEKLNFDLILCETQLILIALRTGGNSVLKIFDTFTSETIKMLNNFVCHFEKWFIYKPRSSRPANSEKYLICLNKLYIPNNFDQSNLLKTKLITCTKKQCHNLKILINMLENNLNIKRKL